jgi:hypothetical protein
MKLNRIVAATSVLAAALALPFVLDQGLSLAAAPAPGAKGAAAPAAPPPAAPTGNCKTFGAGKCCSPDVTMHLGKEAVYAACGESEATFIGEAASKDMFTCKYHFKVAGEDSEDTVVQVYVGTGKEIPDRPTDPFFSYKKVGKKVWMTDKAKSPKAAAMSNATTGLYTAGKGFYVMVSASTKVCTRSEVASLAKNLK